VKLYVAGPMTGLPEFNYPAFFEAEKRLQKFGYETVNPARQEDGLSWADYMRLGVGDVLTVDGVAVLDGWEQSRGARLEVHVAIELGLPVRSVKAWLTEGMAA